MERSPENDKWHINVQQNKLKGTTIRFITLPINGTIEDIQIATVKEYSLEDIIRLALEASIPSNYMNSELDEELSICIDAIRPQLLVDCTIDRIRENMESTDEILMQDEQDQLMTGTIDRLQLALYRLFLGDDPLLTRLHTQTAEVPSLTVRVSLPEI